MRNIEAIGRGGLRLMPQGNWSRRGFLRRTSAALLAAGLPAWAAREAGAALRLRADDPPIPMGLIGAGGRGSSILDEARRVGGKWVAVCDVDARHRVKAIEKLGGGVDQYNDFRELLDRKDIRAVAIATPDHWHAPIAAEALRRGKAVYCEKPLTLTIAEGQGLVKLAHDRSGLVQVGSQQRSDARFRLAADLVRNGRIGKVRLVEVRIGSNPAGGPFPVADPPRELDWNFWLGPTPEVEYVEARCHGTFRWWTEYSGGKLTDWGAHHLDVTQWALGADGTGPVRVVGSAEWPQQVGPNTFNVPPEFAVTYTYAPAVNPVCDGTQVLCTSRGENGVRFVGEGGSIFVSRERIEASDPKLLATPLPDGAPRSPVSDDHMRNFLEAVRGRDTPVAPIAVGHRSASVCHLGGIALRLGRALQWDPARERFFGDAPASQMIGREPRASWKFEI